MVDGGVDVVVAPLFIGTERPVAAPPDAEPPLDPVPADVPELVDVELLFVAPAAPPRPADPSLVVVGVTDVELFAVPVVCTPLV